MPALATLAPRTVLYSQEKAKSVLEGSHLSWLNIICVEQT
jgi:hypothetical protein